MRDRREGLILNYRIGRKTQHPKQCLIKVLGAEPSDAKRMIGLKGVLACRRPKICDKIVDVHGRKGVLRGRFNRGVPGQALCSLVKIVE